MDTVGLSVSSSLSLTLSVSLSLSLSLSVSLSLTVVPGGPGMGRVEGGKCPGLGQQDGEAFLTSST